MISNIYANNKYDFIDLIFKNKEDLISYLKNAKTSIAFSDEILSSQDVSESRTNFTKTSSYDEAFKLFEYGWYEDFEKFLSLKKQIDKSFPYLIKKSSYFNHMCGNVPNVFNAINNIPLSMRKLYKDDNVQKIITVYYNCSTPWFTTKEQIYMNGLLTLSLIDFFDSLGFRVNLNFFEISVSGNQVLHIDMTFKSPGEKINLQKFYFPFCHPSFLRRIIFRVMETTKELKGSWTMGYGRCMNNDEVKELLKLDENCIFINWPKEMGVEGKNVSDDIQSFLEKISLKNYIKVNDNEYKIYDQYNTLYQNNLYRKRKN